MSADERGSLADLRARIDVLDEMIVSALSERFALALKVGAHKGAEVQDEAREAEVLARVERLATQLGGDPAAIRSTSFESWSSRARSSARSRRRRRFGNRGAREPTSLDSESVPHPQVSGLLRMPIAAHGEKVGRDDQGAFDGKPIRALRRRGARIRRHAAGHPLPWLNYLGQDDLFGLCTNTGGGYTFWRDARLRRLTRYRYNDVPLRLGRRYLYVRGRRRRLESGLEADEDAARSLRVPARARLHPDLGAKDGVEVELLFFIPPGENVEIWRTTVRNTGGSQGAALFSYVEFCFYEALNDMSNYQRTYSIGEVEVEGSGDLPHDRVP